METDNLRYWRKHADVDPRHTKPIKGKAYQGTSPNPHYVVQCLTDLFGPIGEGWGFRVVAEGWQPLGDELLHWCRITMWHTHPDRCWESYGQTKALMRTRSGMMADEDSPKKSLTDALVKGASYVGVAASIFLGRWDDSKYVQQLTAEFASRDSTARESQQQSASTSDPQIDGMQIQALDQTMQANGIDRKRFAAWVRSQPWGAGVQSMRQIPAAKYNECLQFLTSEEHR